MDFFAFWKRTIVLLPIVDLNYMHNVHHLEELFRLTTVTF